MDSRLDLSRGGHRIEVSKNDRHPESYLWIDIDGSRYFLGVLTPGMTKRDVRAMAVAWLEAHPPTHGP